MQPENVSPSLRLVLLLSLVGGLYLPGAEAVPTGPGGSSATKSESLPPGVSQKWWGDVHNSIRASEYEPTWQEKTKLDVAPTAWVAPNRAQNFRTYFTDSGAVVVPPELSEGWRWEIGLAGAAKVKPRVNGNRVEYRRGDVTEWYVNNEKGLEQGFTVARPAASFVNGHELRLALQVGGTLLAEENGGAIDFVTRDGALAIRYDKLVVVDANGKQLNGSMELRKGGIDLVADVRGAAWPVTVDPLATSPNWTAESNKANAYLGISVASAGDVNRDGYSDVIVAAYRFASPEVNEGRVFVYHGSAAGLSVTPNWMVESNQAGSFFGYSVASAGDVNRDGYSDVIVGAHSFTNGQTAEGRAFVYHGSATGLSPTANWTAESDQAEARLGNSVASAGDVNGDGYSDVIVDARWYDNGQTDEGRAYVYHGSATGLSPTANWMMESNQAFAQFGISVASAGDIDRDGYSDVIVGAEWFNNGQDREGRAFVYRGSAVGLSLTANWTAESDQAGASFGFSVASAGDVNRDGYGDVIVGAKLFDNGEMDEGRAYVYHGSATGLSRTANWTMESNQTGASFGYSVASAGDVNKDGYSDVIVGAQLFDNGETDEGRAFVYHGSAAGLSLTPNWTAESNQAGATFGISVASAGDVNGDGSSDVIVGAQLFDNGETNEGRAFVYHGQPTGPTPTPTMSLDRTSLTFAATTSGTAFSNQTGSQTVRLTQGAGPGVTWTATSSRPWLTVTPASGTGSAALSISVKFDASLPASGTTTGAITFALTGTSNTVGPINVPLTVVSSTAAVSRPFGSFDTPAGDATVLAGSIGLSGWTLDNIGVKQVELWRDLQPGETTPPFAGGASDPRTGRIFIANATFVAGARPDVEGLYPTTPANYRAGWGYLMLTWGLFGQGNGTYRFYAFAVDQENNTATIGTKTVVIRNNTATKPFGSIDTPGIGGDASGPNFGWGLTPKVGGVATCKIPANGVQVSIDSGPLQPVVYGTVRSDIAGAFTGFSNSAAAGGHFIFDWSTLKTGSHTIGWLITDNCNRADGVGSRFFTVTGGTNLIAGETGGTVAPGTSLTVGMSSASVATGTESAEQITVARGFGELPEIVMPGEAGSRTVEVKQGDRIEVRLPRGFGTAYQLVAGQRRGLPTGATWDDASGTFYWQPAPGFLGRYRVVFSNGSERISLRVVVVP